MPRRFRFFPLLHPALLAAIATQACGGSEQGDTSTATSEGPSPGAADPAVSDTAASIATDALPPAAPAAAGTAPPAGAGQDGFIDDPADAEPELDFEEVTEGTACAGLELVPEQVVVEVPMDITTTTEVLQPVAFYLVLDNSSSMQDPLPGAEGAGQQPGGFGQGEAEPGAEEPAAEEPAAEEPAAGEPAAEEPAAGEPAALEPAAEEPAPTTRWELAVSSLQAFVNSPESAGVDVAIQYFNPPGQAGGNFGTDVPADDPLCDGTLHSTPDVEMGRLPDNAAALTESLATTATATGTPTLGALTGGIEYCKAFEMATPDEQCVVVLVTDGVPSSCSTGGGMMGGGATQEVTDTLVAIAAAGLTAGVEVFTVGMDGVPPEGFTLLDAVAAAGGTDCTPPDVGGESCNVSSTGSAGLVETLTSIRETVTVTETVTETTTVIETTKLDCQWVIPEPPEEEGMINPDRVNVTLALDGAEGEFIPSVADEAACAANGGVGWYYDNPAAPTQIFACTESCSQIQNGVNPVVEVLLGCERVVVEVMR